MSDREHAVAMFLGECRRRGVSAVLGISIEAAAERLPIKELTALRRAISAAPPSAAAVFLEVSGDG